MSQLTYLDFEFIIEGSEGKYRARVINSPIGPAVVEFDLPFTAMELENFLLRVGRPRQTVRRIDSPEMDAAKKYGARLFEAAFGGDVYACFQGSLNRALEQQKGLRLKMHIDAPELNDLPWEYLYNERLNRFLSLAVESPLVRYLDLPQPPQAITVVPPLKVLAVISSPADSPPLDVEREWSNLKAALGDLEQRGLVSLERLETASLAALQKRLRQGEYHIFHFIGHGGFDQSTQQGVLLFEDETRRGRILEGETLGTLLHNHRPLRLAILNACEGARTSAGDPYAGVAQSLVQQGIPAVIAMQFEITDQAAITFAHEFYAAIADGYPVDAALAEARTAIFAQGNDIEWGTPVYFTRAPDGRVFDVSPQSVAPKLSQPAAEGGTTAQERQVVIDGMYALALKAIDAKQWQEARGILRQAAKMDPGFRDIKELRELVESEIAREKEATVAPEPVVAEKLPAERGVAELKAVAEPAAAEPAAVQPAVKKPAAGLAPAVQGRKISTWAWIVGGVVILGLIGGFFGVSRQMAASKQKATQVAIAYLTATAETAQALDIDKDGLSSAQETSLGTDPNNPDSDNDGLADGQEVNDLGTSPLNTDTDGDGLTDNLDPAPLQLPTPTVAATDTPEPILATPTEPSTPTPTIPAETPTATAIPALITDDTGIKMALVPAGEFEMGSSSGNRDELPMHTVTLDSFYIDLYEVTNALYAKCVEAGVCSPPSVIFKLSGTDYYGSTRYADYPVFYLSWENAQAYCGWRGARLPTEAEWEKAALGTDGGTYPWGEGVDCNHANYAACNLQLPTRVGKYSAGASPFGIFDMAGNVAEWVADWYNDVYDTFVVNNPTGPEFGTYRVVRGGSYKDPENNLRGADRDKILASSGGANFLGFRCARTQ